MPKQAIENLENSAYMNPEKCVSCGLCLKACPFHAIVYVPVPCEESCPVNAISRDSEGKQFINDEKCISCGKCITSCPFGAVVDKSQIVDVLKNINNGEKVVAIIAPSIARQFQYSIEDICKNLRAVGFSDTLEAIFNAYEDIFPVNKEFSSVFSDLKAFETGRGFSSSQRVANAVKSKLKDPESCHSVFINGLDRKSIKLLSAYAKKAPGNLIEVMSCEGGCVAGPCVIRYKRMK